MQTSLLVSAVKLENSFGRSEMKVGTVLNKAGKSNIKINVF